MKRLVLATIAIVGLASAIDLIVNGKCEGGKFGICPEGERCTEFGYCIKTGNSTNDLTRCQNGNKDCPKHTHCNEFKICVQGDPSNDNGLIMCTSDGDCASWQYCTDSRGGVCASRNDLQRCKKHSDCDISKQHCNEFGICIRGAPSSNGDNELPKCKANKDCASDHHCNEFHICIPGAPSQNDLIRCTANG